MYLTYHLSVRILPQYTLYLSFKATNGGRPSDETAKTKAPCHSWCGCSKAISALRRPKWCGPSPQMVRSLYACNISERDVLHPIVI